MFPPLISGGHRAAGNKDVLHGFSGNLKSFSFRPARKEEPGQALGFAREVRLLDRDTFQRWRRKLDVVLRQQHRAGERLFVDYAGATFAVQIPQTGEVRPAQIFVAVLGASSYTYAEATWSQDLANWTGSHMRAFEFFGGVPEIVVPDYVPGNIIGLMWPRALS